MKLTAFLSRLLALSLFFALGFGVTATVQAQSKQSEQISWDDEDEEEEEAVVEAPKEVVMTIDGEAFDIETEREIEFERDLTLSISVRNLRPSSNVWFKAEKTGMKLASQTFKANKKGELDLEVKTGKRKGGATGEIHYYAADGTKFVKRMKVKIR